MYETKLFSLPTIKNTSEINGYKKKKIWVYRKCKFITWNKIKRCFFPPLPYFYIGRYYVFARILTMMMREMSEIGMPRNSQGNQITFSILLENFQKQCQKNWWYFQIGKRRYWKASRCSLEQYCTIFFWHYRRFQIHSMFSQ